MSPGADPVRRSRVALMFSVLFGMGSLLAQEPAIDTDSGLVIDEHWQLVKAHCTVCHSANQVTQQRGNRETWLRLIRWMQEKQGLWQFDAQTESRILDYLEKNYAPSAAHRRPPLSPDLLPAITKTTTG